MDILNILKAKFNIQKNIDERQLLLEKMPKGSVCAEIGSWTGDFSHRILEITKPKQLHLIDPWLYMTDYGKRWYGGMHAKNQKDMDEIYENIKERFKGYTQVHFHRGLSEELVKDFPDLYFDWVYVDGNHYYEFVKKDLELYSVKVKHGGFITGDDYHWTSSELKGELPVKRAVDEFIESYKYKINKIGNQYIITL